MVFSNAYVITRVMLGAALANDNVSGNYFLSAEYFYAQSFAVRFASIS
jgi:hypothetical protein